MIEFVCIRFESEIGARARGGRLGIPSLLFDLQIDIFTSFSGRWAA